MGRKAATGKVKDVFVKVRFDPLEKAEMDQAAAIDGVAISTRLRESGLRDARAVIAAQPAKPTRPKRSPKPSPPAAPRKRTAKGKDT